MEQEICVLKHKEIDKHFELVDEKLKEHGGRLDKNDIGQATTDTVVKNLCEQIKDLVNVIKWLIGGMVASGLGFIVWYVQNLPRM